MFYEWPFSELQFIVYFSLQLTLSPMPCIAEKFGRDWEIACNQHHVLRQHDFINHRPESGLQVHIV
jgi:hypothetical protein